jgi:hypothetical protein
LTGGSTTAGSGTTVGGSGDPDYVASRGNGGAHSTSGQQGMVIIKGTAYA